MVHDPLLEVPTIAMATALRAEALQLIDDLPARAVAMVFERFAPMDALIAERMPLDGMKFPEPSGRDAWVRVSVIHDAVMHIGHRVGLACAHSNRGLELHRETMQAIREQCTTCVASAMSPGMAAMDLDTIDAIDRCASEVALVEAANAWMWVPLEERSSAVDMYPWLAEAEAWLSRHDDINGVRSELAYNILIETADQHDLVRDAVITALDIDVPIAAHNDLTVSMREQLKKVKAKIHAHEQPWQPSNPPTTDGLMLIDAAFVSVLEKIGDKGREFAAEMRKSVPQAALENGTSWYGWLPSMRPVEPPRRLDMLAKAVWCDLVEPDSRRPDIEVGTPGYVKIPKMTAGVSWAFGGPAIEVDGSQYVQEPGFAEKVLMPRTAPLLIDSPPRGPEQASLPLGLRDEEDQPFAVAVTNATQWGAISPLGSKIALLALADERAWKGMFIAGTAERFVQLAYPLSKRIQPRELESVGAAFHELGKLIFYLHDCTKVRPFDTRSPTSVGSVSRDMQLGVGLGNAFRHAVGQMLTGKGHGAFGGAFVLNLSGALSLPNNQPAKLRHLVRASAAWNAAYGDRKGGFNEARLPWYDLDQWAKLTNAYPVGVVEYLAARGDERRKLSNRRAVLGTKRKELLRDIEELADKYGLVRVEKRSSKGTSQYRLAPPKEWLEAWAQIRAGAVR